MHVTYRLNPAFAVTNLSSSSTSGWKKKPKQTELRKQQLRKVSNSKKDPLLFIVYCQQMFYLLGSTLSPDSAHFHTSPCQWAPEGSQCPCVFDTRISAFPQTEQHFKGRTAKTASLYPGLFDLLYYGLPQRAAGSWLECQWCLSHHESAGHPEPAPGSAGPCTSPESTSSSVSPPWWAVQVWKQSRTDTTHWQFAQ